MQIQHLTLYTRRLNRVESAVLLVVLLYSLAWSPLFAEEQPPAKAVRILSLLEKRPLAKSLFDRFCDTWLDSGTTASCEAFLKKYAEKNQLGKIFLARFHLRQRDYEAAKRELQSFANLKDLDLETQIFSLLELAKIASQERDYRESLDYTERISEAFESKQEIDPNLRLEFTQFHASLLIKTGDSRKGLELLWALIEQNPGDDLLREDIVRVLIVEGMFDDAILEQQNMIQLAEEANDSHSVVLRRIRLGEIFQQAGRHREANDQWRLSLPACGYGTWLEKEILTKLELSYKRNQDAESWSRCLQELIAGDPGRIQLLVKRAGLLARKREYEAAINQWKEILEKTPGDRDLQRMFIVALAEMNRPGQAAQQTRKLLEVQPDNPELYFELARFLELDGKKEAATACLLEFYRDSERNESIDLRIAHQLTRLDLSSEAEIVFQNLLHEFPESLEPKKRFAVFLYKQNRKEESFSIWKRVAEQSSLSDLLSLVLRLEAMLESSFAFELLELRNREFSGEWRFLYKRAQLASILKRSNQITDPLFRSVERASSFTELHQSIQLAMEVNREFGLEGSFANIQNEAQAPSPNQICFLAFYDWYNGKSHEAIGRLKDLEARAKEINGEARWYGAYSLAWIFRQEKLWSDGVDLMMGVLDKAEGRRPVFFREGVFFSRNSHNLTQALQWCREWKASAVGATEPFIAEAQILADLGKLDESLEVWQKASRNFENDYSIQMGLAKSYMEMGNLGEAERVYWRLYEAEQDSAEKDLLLIKLTDIAIRNERIVQLIERFQIRQRSNSQSVEPLLALSTIYKQLGKAQKQLEVIEMAYALDRENVPIGLSRAHLLERAGRIEEAIQGLMPIFERDQSGLAGTQLIRLLVSVGRYEDALRLLPDIHRDNILTAEDSAELATEIMRVGEWEVGAGFLESQILHYPDDLSLRLLQAISLREQGKREESVEVFFLALRRLLADRQMQPSLRNGKGYSYSPLFEAINNNLRRICYSYREIGYGNGRIYSLSSEDDNPFSIPLNGEVLLPWIVRQLLSFSEQSASEITDRLIDSGIERMHIDWILLHLKPQGEYEEESDLFFKKYRNNSDVAIYWLNQKGGKDLGETVVKEMIAALGEQRGASAELSGRLQYVRNKTGGEGGLSESEDFIVEILNSVKSLDAEAVFSVLDYVRSVPLSIGLKKSVLSLIDKYIETEGSADLWKGDCFSAILSLCQALDAQDLWIEVLRLEGRSHKELGDRFSSMSYVAERFANSNLAYLVLSPEFLSFLDLSTKGLPLVVGDRKWLPRNPDRWLPLLGENPVLQYIFAELVESEKGRGEALARVDTLFSEGQVDDRNLLFFQGVRLIQRADSYGFDLLERARKKAEEKGDVYFQKVCDLILLQAAGEGVYDWEIIDRGIEAAKRLRVSPILEPQTEWPVVASFLRRHGLNLFSTLPTSSSRLATSGSGSGLVRKGNTHPTSNRWRVSERSLSHLLNELILTGRKEDAARVAARRLPIMAADILSLNGDVRMAFPELVEILREAGLTEEILGLAVSDSNNSDLHLARFASLCEVFGAWARAAESYEKLIEQDPDHTVFRLRQILATARFDTMGASRLIEQSVDDPTIIQHLDAVMSKLSDLSQRKMEERLRLANWLLAIHKAVGKKPGLNRVVLQVPYSSYPRKAGKSWMQKLRQQLGQVHREEGMVFEELVEADGLFGGVTGKKYGISSNADFTRMPKFLQLDRERRRLLKTCLTYSLEESGRVGILSFQTLVLLQSDPRNEIAEEELFRKAGRLIEDIREEDWDSLIEHVHMPVVNYRDGEFVYSTPEDPASPQSAASPVAWMIEYIFRQTQQGMMPDLTLLDRLGDKDPRRIAIESLLPLYQCEPGQFSEKLKSLSMDRRHPISSLFPQSNSQIRNLPVGVFAARAVACRPELWEEADLRSLGILLLRSSGTKESVGFAHWVFHRFLDQHGIEEFDATMAQLMRGMNDSIDSRDEVSDGQFVGSSPIEMPSFSRSGAVVSLLDHFASRPDTFLASLRFARREGLLDDLNCRVIPFVEDADDLESLLPIWEHGGLLADLRDYQIFRTQEVRSLASYQRSRESINSNLLSRFQSLFRSLPVEAQSRLATEISKESAFGYRILQAYLSEDEARGLVKVFDQSIEEIKALSPERRWDLARFARELLARRKPEPVLSASEKRTWEWLIDEAEKQPPISDGETR